MVGKIMNKENKKYLINPQGKYEGYPHKSFACGKFLNGYSDHFPIFCTFNVQGIDSG